MYEKETEYVVQFIDELIRTIKGLKRDNVNLSMQLRDCSCRTPLELQAGTPITELKLSPRAMNCLQRANITSIEELTQWDEEGLIKVRNMGKHTLQEIKDALVKYVKDINTSDLGL